jgi:soluble lytic murein transglycosylase-like protein
MTHRARLGLLGSAFALLVLLTPPPASAGGGCLEEAAERVTVHPTLLRAIAWAESQGNPTAVNYNKDAAGKVTSYDYGLMQINTWWHKQGLAPVWHHLDDPCVNVAVGSWILKQCVDQYGYAWNAIGCYNAGAGWEQSPKRRAAGLRYIRRIQKIVQAALQAP